MPGPLTLKEHGMKAVVIENFGAPDVLVCREEPDPVAPDGWVAVELAASALNWHDVLVRRGVYRSPLPHIIGADGAGRRRDTGEDVMILPSLFWGPNGSAPATSFEILGDHARGTYADLVCVPSACVFPKPTSWDWATAAALPLVGVTAYRALFTRGRLQAGESVLILGAGGGVATMAVSLAAAAGAEVVVTSSSTERIATARELGASCGVLYSDENWPATARGLREGFDLVLDSVGLWRQSLTALKPGGRMVVFGATAGDEAVLPVRSFYFGHYDLLGTTMGSPEDFASLLVFLENHPQIRPLVDIAMPLDAAASAHARLERHEQVGKIVLLM
jgi:NADPH:quinone reductase-like Zn-dependent oxidoreductase